MTLNQLHAKRLSPSKTIPTGIIGLIRKHNLDTPERVEKCIDFHFHNNCKCGIKSLGTLNDFATIMHKDQTDFTYQECKDYIIDLYTLKSFYGHLKEMHVILQLRSSLKNNFRYATDVEDSLYAIDIVIDNVAAVQVKPLSYHNVDKTTNQKKNKAFGKPVYYIYYDKDGIYNIENLIDIIWYNH